MKQQSNILNNIRSYYFEDILPYMIYSGNLLEQKSFLNELRFNGEDFINFTYNFLCKNILCLPLNIEYKFKVNIIEKNIFNLIQIVLPPHNPKIDDVLRAYLVFYNCNYALIEKYFLIRQSSNGKKYIIYINPQIEKSIMGELYVPNDDMDFEYHKLITNCFEIITSDTIRKTKTENSNSQNWSKDWKNFDWSEIERNIDRMTERINLHHIRSDTFDVGITQEDFIEYLKWLSINNPTEHLKIMLYISLRNAGVSPDKALLAASDLKTLNIQNTEKMKKYD